MLDIFQEVIAIRQRADTAALCTIVHSSGSVPRHIGSKMIVMEDGRLIGSIFSKRPIVETPAPTT